MVWNILVQLGFGAHASSPRLLSVSFKERERERERVRVRE